MTTVAVNEAYRDWVPPRWLHPLVGRLLESIDQRHLLGLSAVVLTNQGALTHDRKRGKTISRGRKVPFSRCLGLYHGKRHVEAAWIEVFSDQVVRNVPRYVLVVPLFREVVVSKTLFHEIGHHIHATAAPEHREREDVADDWGVRLLREYLQRRHPYLRLALRPLRPILSAVQRQVRKSVARRRNPDVRRHVA